MLYRNRGGNQYIYTYISFVASRKDTYKYVLFVVLGKLTKTYAHLGGNTTQNLLRITFSFNDLMLKTNRLKKDFFYKDSLIFGLDDPVANMSIRACILRMRSSGKDIPPKTCFILHCIFKCVGTFSELSTKLSQILD